MKCSSKSMPFLFRISPQNIITRFSRVRQSSVELSLSLSGEKRLRVHNGVKGFTLIELVMVILITGLLSIAGVHIMQFVVRNSFYLPNQVQADLVAAEALEIIVEGDGAVKGLRFCKSVITAEANSVEVTNQNDQRVTYSVSEGVLSRTNTGAATVRIPYFMTDDMSISGVGGSLFTYYGAGDMLLTQPVVAANVRRIGINLVAQNGAGSSDKYEGISQQSTSVKVNKYL